MSFTLAERDSKCHGIMKYPTFPPSSAYRPPRWNVNRDNRDRAPRQIVNDGVEGRPGVAFEAEAKHRVQYHIVATCQAANGGIIRPLDVPQWPCLRPSL